MLKNVLPIRFVLRFQNYKFEDAKEKRKILCQY